MPDPVFAPPRALSDHVMGGTYALSKASATEMVPRLDDLLSEYQQHVDMYGYMAGGHVHEDRLVSFGAFLFGITLACAGKEWLDFRPPSVRGWGPVGGPPRCIKPDSHYVGHPFKNGTRLPTCESCRRQALALGRVSC